MIGRVVLVLLALAFASAGLMVLGSNADVPSRCPAALWRLVSIVAFTGCGLEALDCILVAWRGGKR